MAIVELLSKLVSGIMIGYLTLVTSLSSITNPTTTPEIPEEVQSEIQEEVPTPPEHEEFTTLPSRYKIGGPIPRILIENADYQKAAVVDAENATTSSTATQTKGAVQASLESALVNVYCTYSTNNYTRITAGTGFFIDESGVVITNAHVAQFLLLEDVNEKVKNVRCILRAGNPAAPRYIAQLLYISPIWISENANLITAEHPTGTGERDYALLYVSGSATDDPLPETFPALTTNTSLVSRTTSGTSAFVAGYPAETLYTNGSKAVIVPVVSTSTIGELYTFGSNYADVFDLSSSPVGEQGASGGPVTRTNGEAIGLIVTKGDTTVNGTHSLRALTLSYIDRTIIEETGLSLVQTMEGNLAYRGEVFKKALTPFLSKLLVEELE